MNDFIQKKMDEGTLQRYLGETVWFPSGMVSPHVLWQELDENSAKATMNFNGTTGSGTFFLQLFKKVVSFVVNNDEGGEILHFYLPHRFHSQIREI